MPRTEMLAVLLAAFFLIPLPDQNIGGGPMRAWLLLAVVVAAEPVTTLSPSDSPSRNSAVSGRRGHEG